MEFFLRLKIHIICTCVPRCCIEKRNFIGHAISLLNPYIICIVTDLVSILTVDSCFNNRLTSHVYFKDKDLQRSAFNLIERSNFHPLEVMGRSSETTSKWVKI